MALWREKKQEEMELGDTTGPIRALIGLVK